MTVFILSLSAIIKVQQICFRLIITLIKHILISTKLNKFKFFKNLVTIITLTIKIIINITAIITFTISIRNPKYA